MEESEIRVEYTDFEEVNRWPRNPKDHDLHEIKKSFVRFGFVNPIILDEGTGNIVAGHGRLDALAVMRDGELPPPKRTKEVNGKWLVPVLRGVRFDNAAEAEAYVLADNKLSEIGGWKNDMLTMLLEEMVGVDGALEGTGFDEFEIEKIIGKDYDYSDLDRELEKNEDKEEFSFYITVPKILVEEVSEWLRYGEPMNTSVARGRGILKRMREESE